MTLRVRLTRLEGKQDSKVTRPTVIYLCSGQTGEAKVARLSDGRTLFRDAGETVDAFQARATCGASSVIMFPDNGRDIL
jgi:hypothetical protein